jgi:hypothetical protein
VGATGGTTCPVPVGAASTGCHEYTAVGTTRALYPLRPSVYDWLYSPPAEAAAGAPQNQGVLPAEPGHPARGVLSDEPEHPADEAREAKPARDPGAPTQAMRDAHAATHLPFRSWCDECVQGRRDAPPHCRSKRAAGEVPEVAFDYAFVRRDDEEEVATLLVMRDRDSKAVRAWVLERKGADLTETVHRAVAGVRELGYRGRVLIRTDGEPALVALRNAITQALPDGATPISTPVGESASNGGIEGAVKIVKGLLRVHLAALERRIGAKFPSGHPVLTWLVEHVGDIVSKYMVGLDGRTAYERLFGRPVREEGLEFGETLHWHHRATRDMNVVLDARWSSGVWLGRRWGGVVHQVFANGKVHEIRGVQRQPRDARWRREALEAVTATPWNREPAAEGELRVLPPLAAPAAAAGAGEPEVREVEYNPHRPHIKLGDLERFGFTAGCRRCALMREGRKAHGVKHGDECRLRVEQCLRDAGDPRLERAERRTLDELNRRAAGVEPALAAPAGEEQGVLPGAAEPGHLARGVLPDEPGHPADVPAWRRELESRGPLEHAAMGEEPPAPPPLAADRARFEDDYARWDAGGDVVMRMGPALAAGSAPKASAALPGKISELYSPPRVTALLPKHGLVAGSTFDLCADVAGVAWDFTRPDDRRRALERIRAEEPFLVVGSPPCTMFSRLQVNLNARKMGKEVWRKRWREAEVLLVFAAVVYKLQVQAGRHFLHEHPAGATSWQHPAIVRLLAAPGVGAVVAHQCQFGLETNAVGGGRAPALKPTRFMSSARAVLEALSKKCPGDHAHAPLLGGTRAKDAAVYPPALCEAIAEGASEQLRRDVSSCSRSLQAVRPQSAEVHCLPSDSRVRDEAAELAAWPAKDTFDEITGAILPPNLVKQARAEEIKFMLQ